MKKKNKLAHEKEREKEREKKLNYENQLCVYAELYKTRCSCTRRALPSIFFSKGFS